MCDEDTAESQHTVGCRCEVGGTFGKSFVLSLYLSIFLVS